jgi:hypothetical protein
MDKVQKHSSFNKLLSVRRKLQGIPTVEGITFYSHYVEYPGQVVMLVWEAQHKNKAG